MGLRDDVQSDVVRKVKSGEVDFGVIIGPFSADDLLSESLMTDSFCVVSRDDHPLAAQERVAWTDLEGQQLVMLDYASGSRPIIDAVMQEYGVSATVVQELGHSATVFGLVEAGVGVSVLPWLALAAAGGRLAGGAAARAARRAHGRTGAAARPLAVAGGGGGVGSDSPIAGAGGGFELMTLAAPRHSVTSPSQKQAPR